jgi:hypothetical protein
MATGTTTMKDSSGSAVPVLRREHPSPSPRRLRQRRGWTQMQYESIEASEKRIAGCIYSVDDFR